jgi:hypothetical protein
VGEPEYSSPLQITTHAVERMAGSRGDGGITQWSVESILEGGERTLQANGRTLNNIKDFGTVITDTDGSIVTAWPETSAAGEESQGWVVEMLLVMLLE